jgi:ligand-binding sensor domain-containing protein
MKNLIRNFACISIIILAASCSQKENTEPILFKHYPRENIKENYGNDIVVDSKNNKWITTCAGLLKFDNQKWTVYNAASGAPGDTLFCLAIDSKDNIYCLTYSRKIVRFDGSNWNTFQNPEMNNATALCVDADDNIWVAAQNGLYQYDGIKWTSFISKLTITYSNYWAKDIISDNNRVLWIACEEGGLLKFDGSNWTSVTINQELPHDVSKSLSLDEDGNVWVGTLASGAFKNQGNSFVRFQPKEIPSLCNTINSIGFDKDQHCWFATEKGLLKYNGRECTSFLENDYSIGLSIEAIAIDKTDDVWALTPNGIYQIYNK